MAAFGTGGLLAVCIHVAQNPGENIAARPTLEFGPFACARSLDSDLVKVVFQQMSSLGGNRDLGGRASLKLPETVSLSENLHVARYGTKTSPYACPCSGA